MALDTICPHCKKKVILSYRIINPYLYGSKIRKCPKCGGDIFDNRWREVAKNTKNNRNSTCFCTTSG